MRGRKIKTFLYFFGNFCIERCRSKNAISGVFSGAEGAGKKLEGFYDLGGGIVGEEVTTEPPKAAEEKKQCHGATPDLY